MGAELYRRVSESGFGNYLKKCHPDLLCGGGKIQKISVNAGHPCPNQDGTISAGGCTYCANAAFSPGYTLCGSSITDQLVRGKSFFAGKYPDMRYLAYFQSYTSTHAAPERLFAEYREALAVPGVVGIVVSTRPDAMPRAVLDYLSDIQRQGYFVLVEYGVESTRDDTLAHIRRHHTYAQAERAVCATAACGVPVGVHLILGLPGETRTDYIDHAVKLSRLPISLIKLHQLQILRGTAMASEFNHYPNRFVIPTMQQYAEQCLDFISHLREDIHLDRFVAQAPPDLVLAPKWGVKNYRFHALLCSMAQSRTEKKML